MNIESMNVSRLIHLNGPPGIGKSTLARRYADEHPGVLDCDIDVLRTLIGGWQDNFGEAGALIRPAALAMITSYLRSGHDVVLPQMIVRLSELVKFETAAHDAGAKFVECMLTDELDSTVSRFHRRGSSDSHVVWHEQVRSLVAANGGDEVLAQSHRGLAALLGQRPKSIVIQSVEDAADETYQTLIGALGQAT